MGFGCWLDVDWVAAVGMKCETITINRFQCNWIDIFRAIKITSTYFISHAIRLFVYCQRVEWLHWGTTYTRRESLLILFVVSSFSLRIFAKLYYFFYNRNAWIRCARAIRRLNTDNSYFRSIVCAVCVCTISIDAINGYINVEYVHSKFIWNFFLANCGIRFLSFFSSFELLSILLRCILSSVASAHTSSEQFAMMACHGWLRDVSETREWLWCRWQSFSIRSQCVSREILATRWDRLMGWGDGRRRRCCRSRRNEAKGDEWSKETRVEYVHCDTQKQIYAELNG